MEHVNTGHINRVNEIDKNLFKLGYVNMSLLKHHALAARDRGFNIDITNKLTQHIDARVQSVQTIVDKLPKPSKPTTRAKQKKKKKKKRTKVVVRRNTVHKELYIGDELASRRHRALEAAAASLAG